MAERKTCYRLPPCPEYDIPGMQAWLEDMSAKVVLYVGYFQTRYAWAAHQFAKELYYQNGNGPIKQFLGDLVSSSKTEVREFPPARCGLCHSLSSIRFHEECHCPER